jgi:hypothetical protein
MIYGLKTDVDYLCTRVHEMSFGRSFQSAPFSIQTRKNTITKHSDKNQNLLNLATAKLNNLTCRSYTLQHSGNNRIQVFHGDGRFYCMFGTYGSGNGQFKGLEGVALLANGNVVVSDRENHRVQIF